MTALATYADLQAEIALWIRRPDQTARIPGYIVLAEKAMSRTIRARRKIGRATATISSEYAAMPTDFGGPRTFKLTDGTQRELKFLSPEAMALKKDGQTTTETGEPQFYAMVGDEFEFYPVPTDDYTAMLSYYRKLPALSDDATSNWVLVDHPDAYLAGALWHGFAYLKNTELATQWEAKFQSIVDEINTASINESVGGVMTPSASTQAV